MNQAHWSYPQYRYSILGHAKWRTFAILDRMENNPELIGRNYSTGEKESAKAALREWAEEAHKPMEGEAKKTAEEIRMIALIGEFIRKEFEYLGIGRDFDLFQEQIHIFPDEIFKKNFPGHENSAAFHQISKDSVYVNKKYLMDSSAKTFYILLHESIHMAQKAKFAMDAEGGLTDARVGYSLQSLWKSEGQNELKNTGLNEIMTDYTAFVLINHNADYLEKELGITEEDRKSVSYAYKRYVPIMDAIVYGIAKYKHISHFEAADILERGQFENTMLALKDIDAVFGKGSIRILSHLKSLKDTEDDTYIQQLIQNYFETEDTAERKRIGETIQSFVAEERETRPNIVVNLHE